MVGYATFHRNGAWYYTLVSALGAMNGQSFVGYQTESAARQAAIVQTSRFK